jgi:hypothetical protein
MKLVFVHGVATRSTSSYKSEIARRNQLFKEVAFPNLVSGEIENPAWGDLVGAPAWGGASLPQKADNDQTKTFSVGMGLGLNTATVVTGDTRTLPDLASKDLDAAVDALLAAFLERAESESRPLNDEELDFFAAATDYLATNPDSSWVTQQMTDSGFASALQMKLSAYRTFGIVNKLGDAAKRVGDRARNWTASALTDGFRDELNPAVAKFLGDVFIYLKDGNKRAEIRANVADALMRAHAERRPDEPLIVIGHSMGGVILVDMLSDTNNTGLSDSFSADLLVTVGSQPGFFEEHKLFAISDHSIGKELAKTLAPLPKRAARWWNVYDPVDILSFRCQSIFEKVEDYKFSSAVGLLDAHTAYFKRPKFYERLRARANDEGLLR